jgi:hypothetical protein
MRDHGLLRPWQTKKKNCAVLRSNPFLGQIFSGVPAVASILEYLSWPKEKDYDV